MSDEISAYMTAVGRHPVLCEEAQLLHCRQIHRWLNLGSPEDDSLSPEELLRIERKGRRSMDTMVRTNLRMVISQAKSFQHRGLPLADLIQEGNLGLIRGLEKYDPTRGYRISTYVYWWIRQGITNAIYRTGRSIRMPVRQREELNRIEKHVAQVYSRTGIYPTLEEIATFAHISVERLSEIMDIYSSTNVSSLDVLIPFHGAHNHQITVLDTVETPAPAPEDDIELDQELQKEHAALRTFIEQLPHREALLIRDVYFRNRSTKEVAEELGISPSRVNQILRKVLERLRARLIYQRAAD